MTILTETAWEESQNIRERNLNIGENDYSPFTLSIDSNDSMYQRISSSNIEPIRQEKEIRWEKIRKVHPYSIRLPESDERQSREETRGPEAENDNTIKYQENLVENPIENNKNLIKLRESIRNIRCTNE